MFSCQKLHGIKARCSLLLFTVNIVLILCNKSQTGAKLYFTKSDLKKKLLTEVFLSVFSSDPSDTSLVLFLVPPFDISTMLLCRLSWAFADLKLILRLFRCDWLIDNEYCSN